MNTVDFVVKMKEHMDGNALATIAVPGNVKDIPVRHVTPADVEGAVFVIVVERNPFPDHKTGWQVVSSYEATFNTERVGWPQLALRDTYIDKRPEI